MNLMRKLTQLNQAINHNLNLVRNSEDVYCLELLRNLLIRGDLLPFTFMSLRPFALAYAINDIMVNKRKQVIEFGSGTSTVILARAIDSFELDCKIISIESDSDWTDATRKLLKKENILDIVDLIHAPLTHRELDGTPLLWYDELTLNERLRHGPVADMVLIDGPVAYNEQYGLNRYFALPFMKKYLGENHCIFLDDSNREGERNVMKRWRREFGKEFVIYGGTLGVHYSGTHFDCCPLKFVDKE